MTLIILTVLSLLGSGLACAGFLANLRQFYRSPKVDAPILDGVSILIPARNEADKIEATLTSALATTGIEFEIVVLDDNSTDGTREILERLAISDKRLRVISGLPLAAGWCGKQFANHQLAQSASYDELVFIDADVRLSSDAVARAVSLRQHLKVDLLSGFPRQITVTIGEQLLIPLIHLILLCYLPFGRMRKTSDPFSSAGCGQLFITSRVSYERAGGHAAIRRSLHDGLTLPRTFRTQGLQTDLFDASDIAQVRMYHGWRASMFGIAKNAVEGIANPRLIVPVSTLLLCGHVLPWVTVWLAWRENATLMLLAGVVASVMSLLPRVWIAWRYDRGWWGVALHPLSMLLFVAVNWWAFARSLLGLSSSWKGRQYAHASEVAL